MYNIIYKLALPIICLYCLASCNVGGNINNVDYKPKIIEPLIICLDQACATKAGLIVKLVVNQEKKLYFALNTTYPHKYDYNNISITCANTNCPFKIFQAHSCSLTPKNASGYCEVVLYTNTYSTKGADIIASVHEVKNNQVSTYIALSQ
jgi:hypothetical protein